MRRRHFQAALVSVISLVALVMPLSATAEETPAMTSAEIVALDPQDDGRRVVLEGEAIGDVLRGDDGRKWVNVLSAGTAVGVWLDADDAATIAFLGDYQTEGDTLRVAGTFNAACDQHGGDLDVHADTMTVVAEGSVIDRPIRAWKFALAFVLGVIATAQTLLYQRAKRRRLTA